ncbi:MAG: CBS domain-containing protein [Candidatus Bathyarchaeota archaeon]|nr:CBS domain-containing protein [Candidatus Bathyarchaeota archaeon]
MNPISVKDVFSKVYATVHENDPLSRCLELFKKEMPPVLAVLDDKSKYVGVITRRWIIRSRLDPAAKVKSLMRTAPKVSPETSLSKAAGLMIESGIRQLPVFEKNKLLGFVTDEHIIHGAVTQEWGNTPIERIMTRAPHTIEAHRSVGAVLSLMREQGISHVPVIDDGKLAGIISIQDIIEHIFMPQRRQTLGEIIGEKVPIIRVPAKGIMRKPVITVSPSTTLREAEKKMHDFDIACLVVTENEKIVGIVTKLDFLEPISQMEAEEKKLTMQFGVKGIAINPDQQGFIMAEFDSFARKYQEALEAGTLFVYMKTHGTSHKGIPLIHCRMHLKTVKGAFVSSSEGYGVESSFRVALDRLDRRLLRSKELATNPKYVSAYLQKMGIPEEEL